MKEVFSDQGSYITLLFYCPMWLPYMLSQGPWAFPGFGLFLTKIIKLLVTPSPHPMVAAPSFFSTGLAILSSSNTLPNFHPLLRCMAVILQLIYLPCLALLLPATRCLLSEKREEEKQDGTLWKTLLPLSVSGIWEHHFANMISGSKSRTPLCSHLFCLCFESDLI